MTSLRESYEFKSEPFQEYVAEKEPDIENYAVKPPYFETTTERAQSASSFILFGGRGSGKSATRITTYKQLWQARAEGNAVPLAVQFTDFSRILSNGLNRVGRYAYAKEIAFHVVEAILVWLAALEEDERSTYLEALNETEIALIKQFLLHAYLPIPEIHRQTSSRSAFQLFGQTGFTRAEIWVRQRWDAVSQILSTLVSGFTNKAIGSEVAATENIKLLLAGPNAKNEGNDYVIPLLEKTTELSRIFGFTGVVVLFDKIDETEETSKSYEDAAALIFPVLSQVQLIEIDNLGWVFFIWDKVKEKFQKTESGVRLDKIAHATIEWNEAFLEEMINQRLSFFSGGRVDSLSAMFANPETAKGKTQWLASLAGRSPRELIRVLDTIFREHDRRFTAYPERVPLTDESVDQGTDTYVKDVCEVHYDPKAIGQVVRLGLLTFTNRDVQRTFRINDASARNRIRGWEQSGMVRLTGTRAAEGGQGGKPQNEYSVADGRVSRIIERQLVPPDLAEEDASD